VNIILSRLAGVCLRGRLSSNVRPHAGTASATCSPVPHPSVRSRMYLLTVFQGDAPVLERVSFSDFGQAISACGHFYEPKSPGAALQFTTVVVRNTFMRAYAELLRAEDLPEAIEADSPRRWKAIKDGNAFIFAHSYRFLIASQAGMDEIEREERV
jgi:hypothetical protein